MKPSVAKPTPPPGWCRRGLVHERQSIDVSVCEITPAHINQVTWLYKLRSANITLREEWSKIQTKLILCKAIFCTLRHVRLSKFLTIHWIKETDRFLVSLFLCFKTRPGVKGKLKERVTRNALFEYINCTPVDTHTSIYVPNYLSTFASTCLPSWTMLTWMHAIKVSNQYEVELCTAILDINSY